MYKVTAYSFWETPQEYECETWELAHELYLLLKDKQPHVEIETEDKGE